MQGQDQLRLARPSRVPAVPVAFALAAGVCLDRSLALPFANTLIAATVTWTVWLVGASVVRSNRIATFAILITILLLGSARHHLDWSIRSPGDIARRTDDEPRFVVFEGTIAGAPWIRPRPPISRTAFPEFDRTSFDCDVDGLVGDEELEPVRGRVRVSITGHLPYLRAGDRVEFRGWFARPLGPSNPGEFDYAEWLHAKGVQCVAWANHPDAIQRLERGTERNAVRATTRIRRSVERLVDRHLDDRIAPIATALLVGSRTRVPDDTRRAFAESGTLHLLAISGLHVGILAAFVWFACRAARFGIASSTAILLVVLAAYAVLTGGRPSVVRATIFVAVAVLGQPWHRRASSFQILAIAAITLLAWRPTDLFDTGAQLSFLAVAAIAFVAEWRWSLDRPPNRIADLVERGPLGRIVVRVGNGLVASWVVMTAIWLFTAPLVAGTFHLVSPVGLLLNVLLIPAVAVVMWCGYAFVVVGAISETFAGWLAAPFAFGLHRLLDVTEWASSWSLGHRYVSGPTAWWTAGFHVGLLAMLFAARRPRWITRVAAALVAWTLFGTLVAPSPATGELRCTFLSVGHGNAVLVELPNGRSLLYDGGSLTSPDYADRVVRSAAWSSRRSRIDAVVVSHADVDHFNAIPDLLEAVPIGTLLVSRPFLDFEQGFVPELCDLATSRGTEIELVHADDRIRLDPSVEIRVLHPRARAEYDGDNQASTVLLVEFAGRRILLTGDIEHDGLRDLTAGEPLDVDVLASPHHGSIAANTKALASWARPEYVVVSAGTRVPIDQLSDVYPRAQLHWTNRNGAITFVVSANGRLDSTTHDSTSSR